jgi:hypothetical protein
MKAFFDASEVMRACNRVLRTRIHVHPPGYGPIGSGPGSRPEAAMWFALAGNHATLIGNVSAPRAQRESFLRPIQIEDLESLPDSGREGVEAHYYTWVLPAAKLKERAAEVAKSRKSLVFYDEGYDLLIDAVKLNREEEEAEIKIV